MDPVVFVSPSRNKKAAQERYPVLESRNQCLALKLNMGDAPRERETRRFPFSIGSAVEGSPLCNRLSETTAALFSQARLA
jgi:hypothetical protein